MASLCFGVGCGGAAAAFGQPRLGAWRHRRQAARYWCCNAAAAANNSDSRSDAFELWSKSGGYHPLEELSSKEKEEIEKAQGGRLSDAEVARTVAEVNTNAVLLVPFLIHGNSMFGTEVAYLVDEHGEIYFELPDDNVVLHSSFAYSTCSLLIGFGDINELLTSDLLPVYENHLVAADNVKEDAAEEDDDFFTSEETEGEDEVEVSDFEEMEDEGHPHPMVFASKLSKVATSSALHGVYKPSTRIALTGFVRSIDEEEEQYVRKKWEDRYLWEEDVRAQEEEEDEEGPDEEEGEAGAVTGESDSSSEEEEESWTNSEVGTSFCKFEIKSIQLSSAVGAHASVGVKEFRYSEPDLLAHAAPDIIQAAGGKKLKRALKSLCYREKGVTIEEAFIIGIDSLGVDVRASCGLELKTMRFPFFRRARCADTAHFCYINCYIPEVAIKKIEEKN